MIQIPWHIARWPFGGVDGYSRSRMCHTSLLAINPVVAGTILPDKLSKLITKGIQWQGELLEEHHPLAKDAFSIYHKNIPMALAVKGKVFTIRLNIVKMTDSQLGFGKKILWKRE